MFIHLKMYVREQLASASQEYRKNVYFYLKKLQFSFIARNSLCKTKKIFFINNLVEFNGVNIW